MNNEPYTVKINPATGMYVFLSHDQRGQDGKLTRNRAKRNDLLELCVHLSRSNRMNFLTCQRFLQE